MLEAPPIVLMSTIQKAPRKMMNKMLCSRVGQNMMATGIQATGGIGRRISTIGNMVPKEKRFIAIRSPSGMPTIWARMKPPRMRRKLRYQPSQYWSERSISPDAAKIEDGEGTFLSPGMPIGSANCQSKRQRAERDHAEEEVQIPPLLEPPPEAVGGGRHMGARAATLVLTFITPAPAHPTRKRPWPPREWPHRPPP